jgi:hypothetical protein
MQNFSSTLRTSDEQLREVTIDRLQYGYKLQEKMLPPLQFLSSAFVATLDTGNIVTKHLYVMR